MTRFYAERVGFTTPSTGNTGDLAIGSRLAPGFFVPSERGIATGRQPLLLIQEPASDDFMIVDSTYTAAPALAVDSVVVSVISGVVGTTRLSLSGNAEVRFLAPIASDLETLFIRSDIAQALSDARQRQALTNIGVPLNCGMLEYSSATSIVFKPRGGDKVRIQGAIVDIASGGASISNSGLAADTLYFAYVAASSGSAALELSTTGHSTDTTAGNVGTEIKTGDASRTLVGMLRTNGSSQFDSTRILSWFNRRTKSATVAINASTSATVLTQVGATLPFITWPDEVVRITFSGHSQANAISTGYAAIFIDGAQASPTHVRVSGTANWAQSHTIIYSATIAQGAHAAALFGQADVGTSAQTFAGSIQVEVVG